MALIFAPATIFANCPKLVCTRAAMSSRSTFVFAATRAGAMDVMRATVSDSRSASATAGDFTCVISLMVFDDAVIDTQPMTMATAVVAKIARTDSSRRPPMPMPRRAVLPDPDAGCCSGVISLSVPSAAETSPAAA